MSSIPKKITISLWEADAIVLFHWLDQAKFENVTSIPVTPPQKQALVDLYSQLEQTDIVDSTETELESATQDVAKDMGWE